MRGKRRWTTSPRKTTSGRNTLGRRRRRNSPPAPFSDRCAVYSVSPTMPDLLGLRGRLPRVKFWIRSSLAAAAFILLFAAFDSLFGHASTLVLYPPLLWILFALAARRYHDLGKPASRLLLLLLPLIGPIVVLFDLAFRKGTEGDNPYGPDPLTFGIDYLTVPLALAGGKVVVNDVTGLNPITVAAVVTPTTVDAVCEAIR